MSDMSKRRLTAVSVLVSACAAVPTASAATPGNKQVTIATGWGLPFIGENTELVGPPYAVNAAASGQIGYSAFNPAWGTLVSGGGTGIHNINYTWDITNGGSFRANATGTISGRGSVSDEDF